MNDLKADLHIHTNVSDGLKTPGEIVQKASQAGLKAISITDHDSYAGYQKARAIGDELGVEVIPGIEITCDYNENECHILGYGFDVGNEPFLRFIQAQKLRRYKRARRMIENLNKAGFDFTIDDVTAESGTMNISRNHIAGLMVKKGYAPHTQAVFDKWLGNHAKAYFKTDYEQVPVVIDLVRKAGGVTILAHPGLYYTSEDIRYFTESGIDGFECIHPSHNYQLQHQYRTLCEKHDLLETGGSDFHGRKKEEDSYFGTVTIDYSLVTKLMQRCSANETHQV